MNLPIVNVNAAHAAQVIADLTSALNSLDHTSARHTPNLPVPRFDRPLDEQPLPIVDETP